MGVWKQLFGKKQDLDTIKVNLRESFTRVAGDVQQLKRWVVHLHQNQHSLHEQHQANSSLNQQELALLKEKIGMLDQDQKKFSQYLSQLVDYLQNKKEEELRFASELNRFKSELELVKARREIGSNLTGSTSSVRTNAELEYEPTPNLQKKSEMIEKNEKQEKATSPKQLKNVEERLLQKFRTHRKEYVFQKILDAVQEEEISTKELEKLIVDDKKLCGRTSFYSYLRELKLKGILDDILAGNRKILLFKHKIARKSEN